MDAKQFIASLPAWDQSRCLEAFDKDELLDAEVSLPVAAGTVGPLVVVSIRRPYSARIEQVVVDVSRLRAP